VLPGSWSDAVRFDTVLDLYFKLWCQPATATMCFLIWSARDLMPRSISIPGWCRAVLCRCLIYISSFGASQATTTMCFLISRARDLMPRSIFGFVRTLAALRAQSLRPA